MSGDDSSSVLASIDLSGQIPDSEFTWACP
jgi:hypothetical protein